MFDCRAFKYEKVNAALVKGEVFTDKVDLSDCVARSYIVKAVNAFGVEGGYSDLATTFPNPPEWVSMKDLAPGRTQVSWKPPERQKIVGVEVWAVQDGLTKYVRITEKPMTENVFELDRKWGQFYQLRAINVLCQAGFTSSQILAGPGLFNGIIPEEQTFRYSNYIQAGGTKE